MVQLLLSAWNYITFSQDKGLSFLHGPILEDASVLPTKWRHRAKDNAVLFRARLRKLRHIVQCLQQCTLCCFRKI